MKKFLAIQRHAFLGLGGNDLPVVRVVALNELCDEQDGKALVVLQRKGGLVLAEFDFHVALVLQQPVQFGDRLRGHDEFAAAFFGNVHFLVHERQPPPVGSHQRHFVVLEADEDAVEHVAGFVRGHGERCFAHHGLDGFLRERNLLVVLELRQRREFVRSQTVDFVKRRAAADAANVFLVNLQLNLAAV